MIDLSKLNQFLRDALTQGKAEFKSKAYLADGTVKPGILIVIDDDTMVPARVRMS